MAHAELKIHEEHPLGIGPRCGEGGYKKVTTNTNLVDCKICNSMRLRHVAVAQDTVITQIVTEAHLRALQFH